MSETVETPQTEPSVELKQLLEEIGAVLEPAREAIASATDLKALEEVRIRYLGKKGSLSDFSSRMGKLSVAEKPIAGKNLNGRKAEIIHTLGERQAMLEASELNDRLSRESVDITLPGIRTARGSRHPVQQMIVQISEIFRDLGFQMVHGPEIEGEWMNFDALNVPAEHPARDMQDTLYTERGFVLRTHTSPCQIRAMLRHGAPLAVITAGRVYRHDSDATHSPMFHQMEGLLVDKDISFGHLKGTLHEFLRVLFGKDVKVRFRPSFFPFTEPSAEVDVWSDSLGRWLEVLGSGMVHPNVLRNGGIDPEEYSGFAFGLGLDRLAMVKFGITDLRLLFENDMRFLRQF